MPICVFDNGLAFPGSVAQLGHPPIPISPTNLVVARNPIFPATLPTHSFSPRPPSTAPLLGPFRESTSTSTSPSRTRTSTSTQVPPRDRRRSLPRPACSNTPQRQGEAREDGKLRKKVRREISRKRSRRKERSVYLPDKTEPLACNSLETSPSRYLTVLLTY